MKHYSKIIADDAVGNEVSPGFALFVDLAGPFRVADVRGSDVTPNSPKAQGLLALIATAPGLRRSRIWLQDKLWSESGQAQGASSLRQCLRRLRAALGAHAECITTKSGWIGLDPTRVRVRTQPHTADVDASVEFLEGLDIGDPEFEDWLRDQRLHHSERSRAAAPEGPVDALHIAHRDLAGVCDREDIGAMVAAAALAGYLMQRRASPSGNRRLDRDDLLQALRSSHVPHAHEIVRAIVPFLSVHPREACDRGPALRRH